MINIFYDDRCPLCCKEIEYYKKIPSPAILNWCGISEHTATLEKYGISYLDSLKILHAVNTEGKTYKGVDTFVLIWQHLARWKYLAWFVRLPLIYQMSKLIYSIFAYWRFKNLDHCVIEKKL